MGIPVAFAILRLAEVMPSARFQLKDKPGILNFFFAIRSPQRLCKGGRDMTLDKKQCNAPSADELKKMISKLTPEKKLALLDALLSLR